MKCEIIKDLIPLYSEGLCCEESEALISEHIKSCEGCRLLCESAPEKAPEPTVIPSERETFKKVNRRFRKLSVSVVLVSAVLLVILAVVGYLTAGQMTRAAGMRSFDTIIQSFEAKRIAEYIAEGDFDNCIKYIPFIHFGYIDDIDAEDRLREKDIEVLRETYKAAYGDTKAKKIRVTSKYCDNYSAEPGDIIIENMVLITFEDGRELQFPLIKTSNGRYSIGLIFESNSFLIEKDRMPEAELAFRNALAHANNYDLIGQSSFEILLHSKTDTEVYNGLFQPQYHDDVSSGKSAFYADGCKVTNAYISGYRVDSSIDMLYCDLTIEAQKGSDSGIMKTRIYYDYSGLIPPEKADIQVYTDNKELEEALYAFFGQ